MSTLREVTQACEFSFRSLESVNDALDQLVQHEISGMSVTVEDSLLKTMPLFSDVADRFLDSQPVSSFPKRCGERCGSWAATEGTAYPLGVNVVDQGKACNFALYSRHAHSVTLLLFREQDVAVPAIQVSFDHLVNKSGRIWHCRLPIEALEQIRYYAYSLSGPADADGFHAFDPDKVLLDPYAKSVYFPKSFDREAAITPGSNAGKAPLGVLVGSSTFSWGEDHRPHHESGLVIYEMHVRGFTANASSGVDVNNRGTFAGVAEKIPYLQKLGVTAVELMPVMQFDPQEGNYWGYMPLNFFSPHHEYASSSGNCGQHDEFRRLVKSLHAADIEVILDVVFNHTVEGNQDGPTYCFKGIDNATYYLASGQPQDPYANFSGTGNTLNCDNRHVRRMILDSMRYWVQEMHIDGFRFDLASSFSRREDGSIEENDPPIFGEIRADPVLGDVRLIAEPWDAAGGYQLGCSFPGTRWQQWNGRFRDDVRRFVRGDENCVAALMYRLYGSDDLFPDSRETACRPVQSVNYITSHDGFTLYDQVAYNHKHNNANGHKGQDGHGDNLSWNCGWEGDHDVPNDVLQLRKQQAKNFCAILLLSNGTPMFTAGDEFMNTQSGNNNPYNQDNELTWLCWEQLEENQDVFRFFCRMIAFRKANPSLCRSRFWRDDVKWHGTDWDVDLSSQSRCLAFFLDGSATDSRDLYVMLNSDSQQRTFRLCRRGRHHWRRFVDTSLPSPYDICEPGTQVPLRGHEYEVSPRSIVVLTD